MRRFLWILYQPYKWLIFLPLLALSTVFFVCLGILIVFLFDDKVANRTTGVWWSRFNAYATPISVTVIGKENIDRKQSYVVVPNHQSSFDIFVLYGWLGIDIKWVMKQELRKIPFFGLAGEKGGNIYIDRSNPKAAYASLEKAREKLVDGTSLIMLPEGTRSRTGQLGEFKKGAFKLALDLDIPILPVTIANTRNILPPKSFNLFPGRATMIIHKPVALSAYSSDTLDRFITDVRGIIQRGLDQYSKQQKVS
jgi:1-acyl-sn-glycerol-3-phosphate acyltransferase